ncbi:hypothetical protein ACXR0O_09250 [Verrucomicrobiota bacterium sgz303538]
MDRITAGSMPKASWSERIAVLLVALALFAGGFLLAGWSLETRPVAGSDRLPPASPTTRTTEQIAASSHDGTDIEANAPQKDARKSLHDALEGDDPIQGATRVLAWLRTATVESFRQLAAKPEDFPTPYFTGFDKQFRAGYFSAIAKRWLKIDPENALGAMQRIDDALRKKDQESGFLSAVATLQPELVLKKLPLKERYFTRHARVALETLAARNRDAARRFAEQLTDETLRKEVDRFIATGVAKSDPLAAVNIALNSKDESLYREALEAAERIGPGMVRQVLQAAGGRLGIYAITPEFVLKHPDLIGEIPDIPEAKGLGYFATEAAAAADALSTEERERLLASYDTLPGSVRDSVAAAVVCSWARTEPQKAAEWALAHGNAEDGMSPANTAAQQVFLRWINNDPDKALAWWRELPSSALRDALGTNASTYMAENGQMDAAMEMFRPHANPAYPPGSTQTVSMRRTIRTTIGGGSTDESAATHLAQFLAKRDPAAAGDWFANLPAGVASESSAREVVNAWYNRDPEAVARWIETLPRGESRDLTARAFIQHTAQLSPTGAAEWVETVTDQELRQQSALWVMSEWMRDDPARARQWMSNLRGVDPEWQATILRRWK